MGDISSEHVRLKVQEFWSLLTGGPKEKFAELYAPDAIIFTGTGKRGEPAKAVVVRRTRERTGTALAAEAEVGAIDIEILPPDVAVAAYTYRFHSTTIGVDGSRMQFRTLFGRATHVFQRDPDGALRIVHEHLSSASPSTVERSKQT